MNEHFEHLRWLKVAMTETAKEMEQRLDLPKALMKNWAACLEKQRARGDITSIIDVH